MDNLFEQIKVTIIHKPSENYFVVEWKEGEYNKYKHFCYLRDTTTETCKKEYVQDEALKFAKLVESGKIVNGSEEIIYQTN